MRMTAEVAAGHLEGEDYLCGNTMASETRDQLFKAASCAHVKPLFCLRITGRLAGAAPNIAQLLS